MTEKKAKEIINNNFFLGIANKNKLQCEEPIVEWERKDSRAWLQGYFDSEELEAIAWWMRNQGRKNKGL